MPGGTPAVVAVSRLQGTHVKSSVRDTGYINFEFAAGRVAGRTFLPDSSSVPVPPVDKATNKQRFEYSKALVTLRCKIDQFYTVV